MDRLGISEYGELVIGLVLFVIQCAVVFGVLSLFRWLFRRSGGQQDGDEKPYPPATKTYLCWSLSALSVALLVFAWYAVPPCLPVVVSGEANCGEQHRFLERLLLPGEYSAMAGLLLGLRAFGKLRFLAIALSLFSGSVWAVLMLGFGM
ncbi:MAG: hypothetical protein ACLQOO_04010 [Terriglobia bacterium]